MGKVKSLVDISDETARAHALHGRSFENGSDDLRLRILVEEVGEVARALQDIDNASGPGHGTQAERLLQCAALGHARSHLRSELVQVASLAIRWIDRLDGWV